ncbi:hypothetical protein FOCG_17803 [Fusarium oxysporum f. sp. radicis-lycopersici 26381]|uniref:Uncharacterized protein n=1 Tax=Fusarium oxysporum TaxID=5507 RepID=A0A420PIG5_FUSOX|nr:hypothetical protein FOCG_17803 [Fusarium oxysporum f. sp. radicis-lycopersici 26381]RKK92319.1 hypothetical protein BFJ68_g15944 [Fusarium oxysporum]
MYEGFVVVFSANGDHQNDMQAISKPLAYRVRKLKWTGMLDENKVTASFSWDGSAEAKVK